MSESEFINLYEDYVFNSMKITSFSFDSCTYALDLQGARTMRRESTVEKDGQSFKLVATYILPEVDSPPPTMDNLKVVLGAYMPKLYRFHGLSAVDLDWEKPFIPFEPIKISNGLLRSQTKLNGHNMETMTIELKDIDVTLKTFKEKMQIHAYHKMLAKVSFHGVSIANHLPVWHDTIQVIKKYPLQNYIDLNKQNR